MICSNFFHLSEKHKKSICGHICSNNNSANADFAGTFARCQYSGQSRFISGNKIVIYSANIWILIPGTEFISMRMHCTQNGHVPMGPWTI